MESIIIASIKKPNKLLSYTVFWEMHLPSKGKKIERTREQDVLALRAVYLWVCVFVCYFGAPVQIEWIREETMHLLSVSRNLAAPPGFFFLCWSEPPPQLKVFRRILIVSSWCTMFLLFNAVLFSFHRGLACLWSVLHFDHFAPWYFVVWVCLESIEHII